MATKKATSTATAPKKRPPSAGTAELDAMLVADAEQPKVVTPDLLKNITQTAELLVLQEQAVASLQQLLAEAQAKVTQTATAVLPALLDEAGVKSLTLANGNTVLCEDLLFASISKANAPAACKWLRENKLGDIIKSACTVTLPKGAPAKVLKALEASLRKQKLIYEFAEGVHPSTLKAFVRESKEKGRVLPDAFTVHEQPMAKVVPPKAPKVRATAATAAAIDKLDF